MFAFASEPVLASEPVHEVTIDYKFAVGKYEVTLAEWDACVAAGGCTNRLDDLDIVHGNYPVHNVSWDDAQEYVRWLSRETGKPYRLLSEAEWEYAARAGTTTKYWWGNGAPQWEPREGEFYFTRFYDPVGLFEPNPFGLFDTEGNVSEWVEDCMALSYEGAPSDGSAMTDEGWFSSNDCDHRMVRSLASETFWDKMYVSASAVRGFRPRDLRESGHGFRCARTLD